MQLSKSDYLLFLKHPAWLWLKKHDKDKLPPPDAALEALFAAGHRYESYAEQIFASGTKLGFDNFAEYRSLPQRTRDALANGARTIFQGRFEHGETTCIIDVLERVGDNLFDLSEIKASTSVKSEHIPDLAFQVHVLEGAGLRIRNVNVVHVNRDYVRDGEIDVTLLSTKEDVTDRVRAIGDETAVGITQAIAVMGERDLPNPSPRHLQSGSLDDWFDVLKRLKGDWPKTSVYNLAGVKPDQLGQFEDGGISLMEQIPADFRLADRQARQVAVTKSGERVVDQSAIRSFLSDLEYPLYFLDYETFADVVPVFDGMRPYQQVPFQYSLHIKRAPDAQLEHGEYLHEANTNPVPTLLARLREDLGDTGSVIVWYDRFETARNTEMGEMSSAHAEFLADVNARVVDLMDPFKNGWYVDKDFFGSASIKKVLPVVVPDLKYEGLGIQDGSAAQREWMDVVLNGKTPERRSKVLAYLKAYCHLDTLAMVRIYEALAAL